MNASDKLVPPSAEGGLRPHFSLVREAAGLLFVSGQLPFGPDKTIKGETVTEQTETCLDNIAALLSDYGVGLEDVVKTTIWLSRTEDFPDFNKAYAKRFNCGIPPARSTVQADLMVAGAMVEIEVVALKN